MKSITSLSLLASDLTAYCETCTSPEPEICKLIRREAAAHPKAHWTSGPLVGTTLQIVASLTKARSILDIGTFLGYSAAYLANSQPNAHVVSLELDRGYARQARSLLDSSSLGKRIEILNADAEQWLDSNTQEFDIVFFDSNRDNLLTYYESLAAAVAPGGVLMMDNACLRGKILNPSRPWEISTAEFNRRISEDRNFIVTILQTRDGVLLAHKIL